MLKAEDLASPGSVLARRQSIEFKIERAMTHAAEALIAFTLGEALSTGGSPFNAAMQLIWDTELRRQLQKYNQLDEDDFSELMRTVDESQIPQEMYSTVTAILAESQATALSRRETEAELRTGLSLDTPSVVIALTASLKANGMNWRARIKRDARTAATRFEGWLANKAMNSLGIAGKKWVTRHDVNVRLTHNAVDGVIVPVHKMFWVGGEQLAYPGDRRGSAKEVINCRCVMTAVWKMK